MPVASTFCPWVTKSKSLSVQKTAESRGGCSHTCLDCWSKRDGCAGSVVDNTETFAPFSEITKLVNNKTSFGFTPKSLALPAPPLFTEHLEGSQDLRNEWENSQNELCPIC